MHTDLDAGVRIQTRMNYDPQSAECKIIVRKCSMKPQKTIVYLSGREFRARVRAAVGRELNNPTLRVMEALGVLQPLKNTVGSRMFAPHDVRTAIAWIRANPPRPRGRPPLSAPDEATAAS